MKGRQNIDECFRSLSDGLGIVSCFSEAQWPGGFNDRHFPHSSGGWKPKTMVPVGALLGKNSPVGLQVAVSSLGPRMLEGRGEVGRSKLYVYSHPILRAPPL